nr:hypothetical protein [Mycoplasmopsis bovis]
MELALIIPNICNSIVLKDVLSTLREQDNQDFWNYFSSYKHW